MGTPRSGAIAAPALALALTLTACGAAAMPPLETPTLASRCRIGASQTSVLVTEWPGAEKANLEAMLDASAVAVAFSGCEMRILPSCRLPGSYVWQRTTPTVDVIEIRNQAELYTKLPLGAVSLSGELSRSGSLAVETTVAGQRRLQGMTAAQVPADPACAEATHLVDALSLGAFSLTAGHEAKASGTVNAPVVGEAGGKLDRSTRLVRSAGLSSACAYASAETPSSDCASPIQVFLSPIPGRGEDPGPPGTVSVDFVSTSDSVRWDVYIDDQAACTTPCAAWVDPNRPLALRTRETSKKLSVERLATNLGPLQIAARPTRNGPLLTGMTFTSLGGMAVITGITLTAIGCSDDDREGMCNAGLITGVSGAAVTAGAIWLMLRARAKLEVRPLFGNDTFGLAGGGAF
jgi:hypothetical protein